MLLFLTLVDCSHLVTKVHTTHVPVVICYSWRSVDFLALPLPSNSHSSSDYPLVASQRTKNLMPNLTGLSGNILAISACRIAKNKELNAKFNILTLIANLPLKGINNNNNIFYLKTRWVLKLIQLMGTCKYETKILLRIIIIECGQ